MDVHYCLDVLDQALTWGQLKFFNTDQGAQFTSRAFTEWLQKGGVRISMDGRGRVLDHVCVERLWRTVKYEEVVRHEAIATIAAVSEHSHDAACCSISSTQCSTTSRAVS
jgi:transposase InsO family protein